MSEWFTVDVGLRRCFVMSPWLFIVYMDGVGREVNVRLLGKGLELLSANGGRFEINQLLFADDTALVADSEKLWRLLSEFSRVCQIIKLRVNVGKSKVMRCSMYLNGGIGGGWMIFHCSIVQVHFVFCQLNFIVIFHIF